MARAELSGHRLGAPAVADLVGQPVSFSATLDFGAGVALGTGVAVHAGTIAATRHTGFVGIVVGACGWAMLCGGRSAASMIRCANPSTVACPVARMRRWASAATLVRAQVSRFADTVAITAAA